MANPAAKLRDTIIHSVDGSQQKGRAETVFGLLSNSGDAPGVAP
jgi:hypothetical protein